MNENNLVITNEDSRKMSINMLFDCFYNLRLIKLK